VGGGGLGGGAGEQVLSAQEALELGKRKGGRGGLRQMAHVSQQRHARARTSGRRYVVNPRRNACESNGP
jgi:hypothetical protein